MTKKAFTLTELLVVVVIIGILSAVVLPKFTKMLDTRKATEAENVMTAVRNEQESRCTLDKDYTAAKEELSSLPKSSKYFTYTLDERGITAAGEKYTLKIPSYTDGRICCESGCDDLNKDYPKCSDLNFEQARCSAPLTNPVPPTPNPCAGRENEHIGDSNWEWTGVEPNCWREVTPPNPCTGRENEHIGDSNWEWTGVEPNCWRKVTSPVPCAGRENEHVGDSNWEWTGVEPSCWRKKCNKENYRVPCPKDNKHYIYYTVNDKCEYDVDSSQCEGCPTICANDDEYVNSKCMCVVCSAFHNVRVNAARNSCEYTISVEDCKKEGKVFVGLIVPDADGSWAACRTCDQFPGKKGRSKDGTKEGCEERKKCPETKYEECAKQGAQVIEWASGPINLGDECYCHPCPGGKMELDGYGHSICACEAGTTLQDCKAKGEVWNDLRYLAQGCHCSPCSSYYRGEGTTHTGDRRDCTNCPDKK